MKILSGSTHGLSDTASFIELLQELPVELQYLFSTNREIFVTRAPGRLDLMGGIADYSGSLVLQWPIANATHAVLQRDVEPVLRIVSLGDATRSFTMSLDEFKGGGELIEYETARVRFAANADEHWAAYVAGVFLVLMRELGAAFNEGARILIHSDVPEGKGVSSSAALEVATMSAVCAAYGIELEPRELALLCQKVENLVVGAPCGVMDQMTSACGAANQLLALLCQPAELQGTIALPADLAVWGIDSGIRHAVGGADYGSVRVAAYMGYRMLAAQAGLKATDEEVVKIEDPLWRGYLAEVTPAKFIQCYESHLPVSLKGSEFLARYTGTTDTVTRVDPTRDYAVRVATAHPIYEHFRVQAFAALLQAPASERRNAMLGELMYQSHASYSACGLGSDGTDLLVELVRAAAPQGLYGAKITGGGSGGTVAVIGRRDAQEAVNAIARRYAEQSGRSPLVISGSSPGAGAFGYMKLHH